jgi:hypothetical protein
VQRILTYRGKYHSNYLGTVDLPRKNPNMDKTLGWLETIIEIVV